MNWNTLDKRRKALLRDPDRINGREFNDTELIRSVSSCQVQSTICASIYVYHYGIRTYVRVIFEVKVFLRHWIIRVDERVHAPI